MAVIDVINKKKSAPTSIVDTPEYKSLEQDAYEHSLWAIDVVTNVATLGNNKSSVRWFTTTHRDLRVMATRMGTSNEIIYTIGSSKSGRHGHVVKTTSDRAQAERIVYCATLLG